MSIIDKKYQLNIIQELPSKYRALNRNVNINNCEQELDELISLFYKSSLEQLKDVINTLYIWRNEIINLFITINDAFTIHKKSNEAPTESRLSNGLIEGLNSIIEQINVKGYSNYERFEKR